MEFQAHGFYTVDNSGGFEVMLSNCGEMARLRNSFGFDSQETSDWLPIEYVTNEDNGDLHPVIDPEGYDIPLNLVMRTNF